MPESILQFADTAAEDLFIKTLSHLPLGLVIYRLEEEEDAGSFRVMHINSMAAALTGIDDVRNYIGKLLRDVAPDGTSDEPYPKLVRVASDGEPADLGRLNFVGPDREAVMAARAFPLPDRSVGVVFEDISERVKLEESLQRQALRFRAIFDATFQLIGLLRPDGTLIEANRTALEFAGLEPSDVIGKPFWECHWWSHSTALQGQLQSAVERAASGEFVRYNAQVRGIGDTRATIDFSLKPVYDGGEVVLLIPEGRDISDLVKTQRALKRLQKRTERILNSAGEGIVGIDHTGKVTFVNEAAAALLGPRPADLVGKQHNEVLRHVGDDGETPDLLPIDRVLVRERTRRVGSAYFERSDGELFPVEYIVTPLRERTHTGAVVVFRDISEQLAAEEALRESELRHRTVVEALREGVILQDADGRILAANAAAERILGLPVTQLVGRSSSDPGWRVVGEDGRPLGAEDRPVMMTLRTGRPIENFVQGVYVPSGELRWINVTTSPIRGEGDTTVAVVATFSDVTEHRRAQEVIRESEIRYRSVLATLDEAVILLAEDGAVLAHNPAAEAILGKTFAEGFNLFSDADRTILDEDEKPIAAEDLPERVALRTGQPQRGVVQGVRDRAGKIRWLNVNAQPIPRPGTDTSQAVVMSFADITEQVESARELRASEAALQNAQQIARIGSWRYDPQDDRVTWSDEMYRIYGVSRDTFSADFGAFLAILHPEDREATAKVIRDAVTQKRPYEVVHRVVRANGEERFVHGRGEPILDASGETRLLQGTCQDITEQHLAREALQRYARELEERNTELEQFAYVASHDLQEPLRMVSSFLQLLQRRYDNQLDDTADEYIAFAVDGAKRMQRLIQDLLAYSRVGTRGRAFQRVAMSDVVQEVLTDLRPAIEEASATVEIDQSLPTITADPTQMRQLLQNLLGNALKFRGEAEPHIEVHASRVMDEGQIVWRFAVTDNGIGIAPEHVDRIFQIFQRLHTRDEYEGTGIGLAICRKIVERHGGRIWLDSEPARGSTFFFTIPARRGSEPGALASSR